MFSKHGLLSLLALAGLASACDAGSRPAFQLDQATLKLTVRWECCRPDGTSGYSARVYLSLPGAKEARVAADCPTLPAEVTVAVNGTQAAVLNRGGAALGGVDGTAYDACETEAFAEVNPLRLLENAVTVELMHGARKAVARFDKVSDTSPGGVARAELVPADGRISQGQELLLTGTNFAAFGRPPLLAEFFFAGDGAGAYAELPVVGPDRTRVRAPMRTGTGRLVIHLTTYFPEPHGGGNMLSAAVCQGLKYCDGYDANILGPFAVEITE